MRTFTTKDTKDFRAGDTISWRIPGGGRPVARIFSIGEFSYILEHPDGYSESIDHHWGQHTTTYTVERDEKE